ncbi:MAG: hypothetical protein JO166_12785 [Deltaproteobacteria bacterium]|nr:hypothetical protein [Deltaproteobacteria bacterium]
MESKPGPVFVHKLGAMRVFLGISIPYLDGIPGICQHFVVQSIVRRVIE